LGHVLADVRSAHDQRGRRIDINAAAAAVATIATPGAVPAKGLVVAEGGIRDGCSAACDIEAAAEGVAGVGATCAVAALGLVVYELAAQDGEETTAPDATARTKAGAGSTGIGGTPADLVIGQHTAQDREP
jgi:hypothetical protein